MTNRTGLYLVVAGNLALTLITADAVEKLNRQIDEQAAQLRLLTQPDPNRLYVGNVQGNPDIPEKFYLRDGQRVFTEIDGKSVYTFGDNIEHQKKRKRK